MGFRETILKFYFRMFYFYIIFIVLPFTHIVFMEYEQYHTKILRQLQNHFDDS